MRDNSEGMTSSEKRQCKINDTAAELLQLILTKKMSYADVCETLRVTQIWIKEFTYPVYQNFNSCVLQAQELKIEGGE